MRAPSNGTALNPNKGLINLNLMYLLSGTTQSQHVLKTSTVLVLVLSAQMEDNVVLGARARARFFVLMVLGARARARFSVLKVLVLNFVLKFLIFFCWRVSYELEFLYKFNFIFYKFNQWSHSN